MRIENATGHSMHDIFFDMNILLDITVSGCIALINSTRSFYHSCFLGIMPLIPSSPGSTNYRGTAKLCVFHKGEGQQTSHAEHTVPGG